MGRGLRYRIIVLCAALLMGGCGELTPPSERRAEIGYYTVRSGDTLYSIAWGYGLDHRDLAAWNNILPPYLIHPGQRLSLVPPFVGRNPAPSSRLADNSSKKAIVHPRAVSKNQNKHGSMARPHRSTTPKNMGDGEKMRANSKSSVENPEIATKITLTDWRWPTKGKVVAKFEPDTGKKGIDISGSSGQPIFSAAAGDVVYSGSGLLGYGNLIIIKHDDVYLSAYGHNSQLLVKEGDNVATGQEIAKMGISPREGALLHFEIRKEGKPVDPTRYLPKQN